MNDNLEQIAQVATELENLIAAMEIPMPPQFHIDQLKTLLPEKVQKLKSAVIKETGKNPWK